MVVSQPESLAFFKLVKSSNWDWLATPLQSKPKRANTTTTEYKISSSGCFTNFGIAVDQNVMCNSCPFVETKY